MFPNQIPLAPRSGRIGNFIFSPSLGLELVLKLKILILMTTAAQVAQRLLQIKAIKLNLQNPFTWASGIQSPIYCDNRIALSYPDVRNFIKQSMAEKSREFSDFDSVSGVATAGIAHGALLADALNLPFSYVRSKAKGHGRQNLIEGELNGTEKVLVVEDLISTGGSCLKAVEAIRERGCEVVGVLAIFQYGFAKAEKAFAEANCSFKTLSNYNILIDEAVKANYVQASDLALLKEWSKDPENWLVVDG
jgi:orotate phosphoribosyltransferase